MNREELTRRLRETFAAEVQEQIPAMNAELLGLEERPDDPERLQAVFRIAHTLKGAARAAGFPLVEKTFHELESRLEEVRKGERTMEDDDFTFLFSAADAMERVVPLLRWGAGLEGSPVADLARALAGGPAPAAPAGSTGARAPAPEEPRRKGPIRLDPTKLDGLQAAAGELMTERARALHRSREVQALADEVSVLTARWRSGGRILRLAAERLGVDARTREAVRTLDDDLRRLARRTTQVASAQGRGQRRLGSAVDTLAQRTRELRLRPFGDAMEPLSRTVRDLAKAAGKEVALVVEGAAVEADRAVLDGLRDGLLQLVRNAVDHGIEPPEERRRKNKAVRGTVRVTAALRDGRIVVEVTDDGAGLDADGIRRALEARGVPVPAEDAELGEALLAGRISTRPEVSPTSGRGVGLDIVRDSIERVRGTVRVTWDPGAGTTFTIECPPSLATVRAVLVRVGAHALAIPTSYVERLLRLRPADLRHSQGRQMVPTESGPVPVVSLARLLGPPLQDRPVRDVIQGVVLEHRGQRLAVAVEELVAEEELVLQPIERNGLTARYVSGATVLGTGRVAPVLEPAALVASGLGITGDGGVELAAPEAGRKAPTILVVDDSLTTRTLEESVLEAAGYEVLTAVDGAEAWRTVQERGCDLVVADVDMPRMNGFDLCRSLRTSKRFREVPVVLVTALESPEDRRRGMEVGADAYLGKSGFDQEQLLDIVRQLIGRAEETGS